MTPKYLTLSWNLRLPSAVCIADRPSGAVLPSAAFPLSSFRMPSSPRLPRSQLLVPQVPFCCFQGLGSPGGLHTLWAEISEVLPAVHYEIPEFWSQDGPLWTSTFGLSLHHLLAVLHHDDSPIQVVINYQVQIARTVFCFNSTMSAGHHRKSKSLWMSMKIAITYLSSTFSVMS